MIRAATTSDIPVLLRLAYAMFLESRYRHLRFNESKLGTLFQKLIQGPRGVMIVAEKDDVPIGFVCGAVLPYEFADDLYAFDRYLYVIPAERKRRAGHDLVKAYIERAKLLGAVEIHIENSTMVETEKTEKFFERMGFARIGGNFVMRVT